MIFITLHVSHCKYFIIAMFIQFGIYLTKVVGLSATTESDSVSHQSV